MILWTVTAGWAGQPYADVGVAAGARTAPESGIQVAEQDEDEPEEDGEDEGNEFEPSALGLVHGRAGWRAGPAWVGVDGAAWLLAPEGDATRLTATPHAGFEHDGPVRVAGAASYMLDWLPLFPTASSRRAEAHLEAGIAGRALEGEVYTTFTDRAFPAIREWGFRTIEGGLVARLSPERAWWTATVALAGQGNQGLEIDQAGATERPWGSQLRAQARLDIGTDAVFVSVSYLPILAFEGELDDDTIRPQFTALGDYADDADALSAGGFLQHRVDVRASALAGPWTLDARLLGRLRQGDSAGRGGRTANVNLRASRPIGRKGLSVSATAGVAAAELGFAESFVDVYGWAGVQWTLPTREPADPE